MSELFQKKLENYAKLIVEVGANIQKEEPLVIICPVEATDFGRLLTRYAYERGSKHVVVDYVDEEITKMKFEYESVQSLEEFPQWLVDKATFMGESGYAKIFVDSEDPELLSHIDPKKITAANKAKSTALKDTYKYTMNDIVTWCIAAIPSKSWAMKVFPGETAEKAMELLWNAIFDATRMNEEDPIAAWEEHLKNLDEKSDILNKRQFRYLHYKSSNGTDLKVEMPKDHIWMSGASTNSKGTKFVANMPTEEVFSAPLRHGVNGTLYATKPLNYDGNLIDKFHLTFKDGEVIEYHAEVGEEFLKNLLTLDENAKYLGEIALVPYDSPISNSNLLFYNTLFDENASCHFAFGKAYPTCVKGASDLSEKELIERGINDSLVHEDFMVGASDLSIIGITDDGEEVPVFTNGNWAF